MTAHRPVVMAMRHAIAAGHYLAAEAGFDILNGGGNAVDAGVAAGIALGVVHSDLVNVAGVAPIMIRMADSGEVVTIDGLGTWPKAASAEFFVREHGGAIPEGLLRTVVPAAPAAWIRALEKYGTLSFGEAAAAAIRFAADGFPVYPLFAEYIATYEAGYRQWPENRRVYLPEDRPPRVGELFRQPDLAATLQYMVDEETAAGGSRIDGLGAARDAFYKGDIASTICDYHRDNGGLMTPADMAGYQVRFEAPVRTRFAGIDVFCCGPWSQGVSLAQALAMLEGAGVADMEHNSPAYIHRVTEILKLVFADREHFVGDPRFVEVPAAAMLDADYLAARRALVDDTRARPEMAPAGDPVAGAATGAAARALPETAPPGIDPHAARPREAAPAGGPACGDTSYVAVIDGDGNMFSATPSDTSADTEIIPGTGLCPSSRGSQSRADPASVSSVAPGKRPRLTPNPAIAVKDGEPFMAFGTPGGDIQIQAMAQVFMNTVSFGMDIQSAIEAPRFATYNFPSSFAPNEYFPGLLMMERRLPEKTGAALAALGHTVDWWPEWTWKAGGVCAVMRDGATGLLHGGADPRRAGYALGW